MSEKKPIKVSPSDFKFLWNDCKHCYYQKVVNGVQLPGIPIPSVFNRLSSLLQNAAKGQSPKTLHPDLPDGEVVGSELFIESAPVNGGRLFIKGRLDLLVRFLDGTYGVVDLKITDAKDEDLFKYDRQLQAYKYSLEHPAQGEPKTISKIGLLVLSPESVEYEDGAPVYRTRPKWFERPMEMDTFSSFIGEVEALLIGPVPAVTPDCNWCQYRSRKWE